ncbi:unnamed protein product, partial [Rotaria sp. Silwood1]
GAHSEMRYRCRTGAVGAVGAVGADLQLCPQDAITVRDPKWPNISPSFELFAELTSNSGTAEIIQTLSNQRDIVTQTANGGNLQA